MHKASKLPDVIDDASLLLIEVPMIRMLQLRQTVSPLLASDLPVRIDDRTYGPTITLTAPP
jgi:hypothetical protein